MTLLEKLNKFDRFAASNGIRITHIEEGFAKAEMDVEERHLNGAGVCQGGAIFTLADLAFAAVSNTHGAMSVGISNSITYHKSAKLGDHLTAECTEVFEHHKLPSCSMMVRNQDGTLIASATGLAYSTKAQMEVDGLM